MRFVDDEWNVQQRLIRLQVLVKSLKANELAQCLIQSLAVEYSIRPGVPFAAMKDVATVNHAALEQVKFFFPQLLDITCFSHTIDNVGKHFEFRFSQLWVSMFSHSAAVRLAWKTRTGTAMKTYSATVIYCDLTGLAKKPRGLHTAWPLQHNFIAAMHSGY